ncbi:MAG: UDP-N-acetylmuramate--L-alanine ligase [Thermodesulfobacteriota bacterium]
MYRGRIKRIHFVGIGGSGMNGIAEVLLNMGYEVTGSDIAASAPVKRLTQLGASVHIGHRKENVSKAQCVVYSSAIGESNPELMAASELNIPIIPRAEMLAELMRMKYGIAIAGTHGKTTTTSLIASIFALADVDPTVVTGGKLNSIGANARLGKGDILVAEADESDGSFLKLTPTMTVVTSIDREHMNHYQSLDDLHEAFIGFMNKVPFYGVNILCLDHPVIQGLLPRVSRRVTTYGLAAQADVRGTNLAYDGMSTSFDLFLRGRELGSITLRLPGAHNVQNALAAAGVALELDIGFEIIKKGLESFSGVERRFHVRGIMGGVTVVDDYGHHPEEIKAVLKGAKESFNKRIVAVFQPHRYSRTADLFNDFLSAFNDVDKLVVTDIYAAGEEPIEGINGHALYEAIREHGHKDITYIKVVAHVPEYLKGIVRGGDLVLTLGAGDVWKAGTGLLECLKSEDKKQDRRVL